MISKLDFKTTFIFFVLILTLSIVFAINISAQTAYYICDDSAGTIKKLIDNEKKEDTRGAFLKNKKKAISCTRGGCLTEKGAQIFRNSNFLGKNNSIKLKNYKLNCNGGRLIKIYLEEEPGISGKEYQFLVKFPFFGSSIPVPGTSSSANERDRGVFTGVDKFIQSILQTLFVLAGIAAILAIIYHGTNLIIQSSIGKPDAIQTSKKGVINVIWSLIIILSSYLLLNTINPNLVVFDLVDTTKHIVGG